MQAELRVDSKGLRRRSDISQFAFESTEQLQELDHVVGQDRAVRAIDFGIDIPSHGYNIYAMGPAGSGRTTTVRRFLDRRAKQRSAPAEWCYVYNFEDQRRPRAISLPPGRASELRREMEDLVEQLQQELPRTFEGEHFEQRRRELINEMQEKQQELYQRLENYLNERGFALIRAQGGLAIAPMLNGEVLGAEQYQKLDPEIKQEFEAHRNELQEEFDKSMREARELEHKRQSALENVKRELAAFVVDNIMSDLRERFTDCEKVLEYLDVVRDDVVENVDQFLSGDEEQQALGFLRSGSQQDWFSRYVVNVLAETGDRDWAPVIIEDNPTYHNLVGRIEHRPQFGTMVTDFTQIRAGSLHKANGGYLVVEAQALLSNAMA